MSEMLQIVALMLVPVAILLGLRSVVIRQNRRLDAQASTPYPGARPLASAGRARPV
ncbi:hypothetical protein [Mycobacterium sp. URHD0025]|jgi:hypothetical protein|uniref:hypothetical protein n=1 Tax=Mycobacterium sp. URHD0025 TaxID=1298864 RepID=UPI0003F4E9DA|nr:hypothetical protein [Mycobacterium sp. URHD0025]